MCLFDCTAAPIDLVREVRQHLHRIKARRHIPVGSEPMGLLRSRIAGSVEIFGNELQLGNGNTAAAACRGLAALLPCSSLRTARGQASVLGQLLLREARFVPMLPQNLTEGSPCNRLRVRRKVQVKKLEHLLLKRNQFGVRFALPGSPLQAGQIAQRLQSLAKMKQRSLIG